MLGSKGTDRLLSVDDLKSAGVLAVDNNGNISAGITGNDPLIFPPPAPTGVTATAAIKNIMVEWGDPAYYGHAYAEIWGSATDSIGTAVLVGMAPGSIFTDAVGPGVTRYYWVRFVNTLDEKSAYNALSGTVATTGPEVSYLLSVLNNQLTTSQLSASLNSRIDLIDGSSSTVGTVPYQLSILQSQIDDLSNTPVYDNATTYSTNDVVQYSGSIYRATQSTTGNLPTNTTYWEKIGDYTSVADAVAAHSVDIATLNTGLAAEVTARTTLAATVSGNTAAIIAEQTARANADTAIASDVSTLAARLDTGDYAAVKTESSATASSVTGLLAKYTVKVDVNGYVSGFGLASTANNATPFSEFAIVADKFSIAPVATNPASVDGSPFFYLTSPTTIGGVSVPAGAYMKAAYIHDATITNAKIADLAVDSAKISDLAVNKLSAGSLKTGSYIRSSNYVAGSQGFNIAANGTAEFSNAIVRGTVYATAGTFSGDISSANGNFRGQVTGGSFTGYAWPAINNYGFYLGPSGLLLGNANNSKYFQVTYDGNVYAPGFNIVNGSATFSGTLSAGTVNTPAIAGGAVSAVYQREWSFYGENSSQTYSQSFTLAYPAIVHYILISNAFGKFSGDELATTNIHIDGVTYGGTSTTGSLAGITLVRMARAYLGAGTHTFGGYSSWTYVQSGAGLAFTGQGLLLVTYK
jgi:hypothetical protein